MHISGVGRYSVQEVTAENFVAVSVADGLGRPGSGVEGGGPPIEVGPADPGFQAVLHDVPKDANELAQNPLVVIGELPLDPIKVGEQGMLLGG